MPDIYPGAVGENESQKRSLEEKRRSILASISWQSRLNVEQEQ
jgi:hypothetical protein